MLADYLAGRLQDFKVHKIVKTSQEWPVIYDNFETGIFLSKLDFFFNFLNHFVFFYNIIISFIILCIQKWLNTVCQDRGWKHSRSPLVWREILDRGGKGMLIGGAEEFQEYVYGYYGIKSSMISDSMQKIATENFRTKQIVDEEEAERLAQIRPIHIAITNASNDLCYNILPGLADGAVFGRTTELAFHLLDNDDKFSIVEGICMELQDLACPLVRQCTPEKTPNIAFQNCSLIILLDDSHQSETETKEEYFHSVHSLYNAYASVIAVAASKDVKLLVAGRGPVNFIATCLIESLPDLPPENIVAMSRGIENHAKGVIAEKLKINASIVADVIVWGNPNGSYLIDISRSRLHEYNSAIWGPGYLQPTIDMIHDDKWLASDFMQLVKKRHSAIKDQVKHEISVSDGQAICSLVKHWIQGTSSERIFSLGVWSGGWYEIPQGIVFSVPVHFPGAGKWNIVMDVDLSETHKDTLITITEVS